MIWRDGMDGWMDAMVMGRQGIYMYMNENLRVTSMLGEYDGQTFPTISYHIIPKEMDEISLLDGWG